MQHFYLLVSSGKVSITIRFMCLSGRKIMYLIASNRFGGLIKTPEQLLQEAAGTIFFPFWSWKIPPEIYDEYRCIIFHMTDVPFGRGGMPLQNLRKRGIKYTVISALECVEEMDTGGVYMKHGFDISFGTDEEVYERAYNIIVSAMIPYIVKHEPTPCPQMGEVVRFRRFKDEKDIDSGSTS